jgi:hypothetical protein
MNCAITKNARFKVENPAKLNVPRSHETYRFICLYR